MNSMPAACMVCRGPLDAPALRHRGICLVVDDAHRAAMERYDRTHICDTHRRTNR